MLPEGRAAGQCRCAPLTPHLLYPFTVRRRLFCESLRRRTLLLLNVSPDTPVTTVCRCLSQGVVVNSACLPADSRASDIPQNRIAKHRGFSQERTGLVSPPDPPLPHPHPPRAIARLLGDGDGNGIIRCGLKARSTFATSFVKRVILPSPSSPDKIRKPGIHSGSTLSPLNVTLLRCRGDLTGE